MHIKYLLILQILTIIILTTFFILKKDNEEYKNYVNNKNIFDPCDIFFIKIIIFFILIFFVNSLLLAKISTIKNYRYYKSILN